MSTLRPSRGGAIGIVVTSVIGAVFLIGRTVLEGEELPTALTIGALAVTASSIFAVSFVRNARVDLGHDAIRVTSFFGTTRELATTSLGHVVIAHEIAIGFGSTQAKYLIVDVAGEPFARLDLGYWNAEQLALASAKYGDKLVILEDSIKRTEFIARYPRGLNYPTRHPWRTVLWILIATPLALLAFGLFVDSLG